MTSGEASNDDLQAEFNRRAHCLHQLSADIQPVTAAQMEAQVSAISIGIREKFGGELLEETGEVRVPELPELEVEKALEEQKLADLGELDLSEGELKPENILFTRVISSLDLVIFSLRNRRVVFFDRRARKVQVEVMRGDAAVGLDYDPGKQLFLFTLASRKLQFGSWENGKARWIGAPVEALRKPPRSVKMLLRSWLIFAGFQDGQSEILVRASGPVLVYRPFRLAFPDRKAEPSANYSLWPAAVDRKGSERTTRVLLTLNGRRAVDVYVIEFTEKGGVFHSLDTRGPRKIFETEAPAAPRVTRFQNASRFSEITDVSGIIKTSGTQEVTEALRTSKTSEGPQGFETPRSSQAPVETPDTPGLGPKTSLSPETPFETPPGTPGITPEDSWVAGPTPLVLFSKDIWRGPPGGFMVVLWGSSLRLFSFDDSLIFSQQASLSLSFIPKQATLAATQVLLVCSDSFEFWTIDLARLEVRRLPTKTPAQNSGAQLFVPDFSGRGLAVLSSGRLTIVQLRDWAEHGRTLRRRFFLDGVAFLAAVLRGRPLPLYGAVVPSRRSTAPSEVELENRRRFDAALGDLAAELASEHRAWLEAIRSAPGLLDLYIWMLIRSRNFNLLFEEIFSMETSLKFVGEKPVWKVCLERLAFELSEGELDDVLPLLCGHVDRIKGHDDSLLQFCFLSASKFTLSDTSFELLKIVAQKKGFVLLFFFLILLRPLNANLLDEFEALASLHPRVCLPRCPLPLRTSLSLNSNDTAKLLKSAKTFEATKTLKTNPEGSNDSGEALNLTSESLTLSYVFSVFSEGGYFKLVRSPPSQAELPQIRAVVKDWLFRTTKTSNINRDPMTFLFVLSVIYRVSMKEEPEKSETFEEPETSEGLETSEVQNGSKESSELRGSKAVNFSKGSNESKISKDLKESKTSKDSKGSNDSKVQKPSKGPKFRQVFGSARVTIIENCLEDFNDFFLQLVSSDFSFEVIFLLLAFVREHHHLNLHIHREFVINLICKIPSPSFFEGATRNQAVSLDRFLVLLFEFLQEHRALIDSFDYVHLIEEAKDLNPMMRFIYNEASGDVEANFEFALTRSFFFEYLDISLRDINSAYAARVTDLIAPNWRRILEIDRRKFVLLVAGLPPAEFVEVLGRLTEFPKVQYEILDEVVRDGGSGAFSAEMTLDYLRLLCLFAPEKVIDFIDRFNYNVYRAIEICQKLGEMRGLGYLKYKIGDLTSAVKIYKDLILRRWNGEGLGTDDKSLEEIFDEITSFRGEEKMSIDLFIDLIVFTSELNGRKALQNSVQRKLFNTLFQYDVSSLLARLTESQALQAFLRSKELLVRLLANFGYTAELLDSIRGIFTEETLTRFRRWTLNLAVAQPLENVPCRRCLLSDFGPTNPALFHDCGAMIHLDCLKTTDELDYPCPNCGLSIQLKPTPSPKPPARPTQLGELPPSEKTRIALIFIEANVFHRQNVEFFEEQKRVFDEKFESTRGLFALEINLNYFSV